MPGRTRHQTQRSDQSAKGPHGSAAEQAPDALRTLARLMGRMAAREMATASLVEIGATDQAPPAEPGAVGKTA